MHEVGVTSGPGRLDGVRAIRTDSAKLAEWRVILESLTNAVGQVGNRLLLLAERIGEDDVREDRPALELEAAAAVRVTPMP